MKPTKYLLFIITVFFSLGLRAQTEKMSSSQAYPWVKGELPANSDRVNYKVSMGEAENLPLARKNAIEMFLFDLGTEQGINISSQTILKTQETIINETHFDSQSQLSNQIQIDQDGFKTTFIKVDEYYEKVDEGYRCWFLYAVDVTQNTNIQRPKYSSKYGFDAGVRSFFVAGWGQFYKKQNTAGILFLSVETASIVGIVLSQNRYNYNINRMNESSSLDVQKEYKKRADQMSLTRNVLIGTAIASVTWSVIDAIATNGAPKYAHLKNRLDLDFQLGSSAYCSRSVGLKFKF